MATVRIRVGASLDANMANVFRPVIDAARKARQTIDAEMTSAGKSVGRSMKAGTGEAKSSLGDLASSARTLEHVMDPGTRAIVDFGKEAKRNFAAVKSGFDDLAKESEGIARRMSRALSAGTKTSGRGRGDGRDERGRFIGGGGGAGSARWFKQGVGDVAGSVGRGSLSFATRTAMGLASGAGVQTDISAFAAKNVDLETRAQDLANAGYMPNDPSNRKRVDRNELMQDARNVGNAAGFDPNKAMEGLQAFVGKTGDLATGREIFKDLAVLSKATGTELEHMVDAAGDVDTQLGDMPNKGEVILQVMKSIAGQGKLGAVEIKDMASQMAKVAASANVFEGARADNIALMGAFAQESRQRGGSASAQQAATSVSSFVNTFSKGARIRAFKGFGVNIGGEGGQIRNAEEIVIDAMNAAAAGKNGGIGKMNENMGQMFMDVRARSATRGFESIYRSAYAGAGGNEQEKMAVATRAVREEFDRLKNVAMSQAEVQESFKRSMDTTESRVTLFNNSLQQTTQELQSALLPAAQALAPVLLDMAKGAVGLVGALTGKTDVDRQRGNFSADMNALNTTSHLNAALRSGNGLKRDDDILDKSGKVVHKGSGEWHQSSEPGSVNPELLGVAQKDLGALDAAIAEQQQKVFKDRRRVSAAHGGTLVHKPAFLDSESSITRLQSDESSLTRMQQQRDELNSGMDSLKEALLSGRVKVEIINMPTPAKAPVVADTTGQQSPNMSTDE